MDEAYGVEIVNFDNLILFGNREMKASLREAKPSMFARKRVLRATKIST